MRRFFKLPLSTKVCSHLNGQAPHVFEQDFCVSCNADMCYLCSQNHSINMCHEVSSALRANLKSMAYSSKKILQTAMQLNEGYLTEANLKEIKCICGVN